MISMCIWWIILEHEKKKKHFYILHIIISCNGVFQYLSPIYRRTDGRINFDNVSYWIIILHAFFLVKQNSRLIHFCSDYFSAINRIFVLNCVVLHFIFHFHWKKLKQYDLQFRRLSSRMNKMNRFLQKKFSSKIIHLFQVISEGFKKIPKFRFGYTMNYFYLNLNLPANSR